MVARIPVYYYVVAMRTIKNNINFSEVITTTDWLVFFLVLIITLGAVVYGHYLKKKTVSSTDDKKNFIDLILMGRQLTLPMFVTTLVATWYGGIFGVTRIAFERSPVTVPPLTSVQLPKDDGV